MQKTPTLDALSAVEQAGVLATLLRVHPELAREAEAIAAERLAEEDSDEVAAGVAAELRALHLEQLADRAGPQWDGGYVEPHEAACELLDEAVQPYLDDLSRRMRVGATEAAGQIARGMLAGLYACRDENDNDLVLTHAGMPDAVDYLASTVLAACAKGGVAVPEQWLADNCPAWT
ncbi:MAG TPA: hypothetical protein VFB84_08435 [Micromonosporaceae bacterium]|nr:hypothetical protein [Micromonosporaceae bacterium]